MNIHMIVSITLLLLAVGVLAIVLARFIRIPYTLLLVILGFILSLFTVAFGIDTGVRASNFQDLMLFILLPVLIFEAAFALNTQLLLKYLPNVLTLATLGLIISTVVIAVFLYFGIDHPGFPFIAALLTGVVISATDPVAVVGQLKALKAPDDLNVLIEGESLFNDATAIVLFSIILSIALGQSEPDLTSAVLTFCNVFFGGIIVGSVLGFFIALLVKLIEISVPHMVVITLFLAYGTFYIAEHLFHVSGIVAVMFAALLFKKYAHTQLKAIHAGLHNIWESLGFIANIFVFVLLGLVVSLNMFTQMWLAILFAIVGAFIARIIAVYFSVWLNQATVGQAINPKYPAIMIWGGLRGAVTIALVLSLPTELPYWWTIQSIGFGIVLFTLIIQATTTPLLVKKLKI
ncbi:cation:proton antiporter [Colwellia psychrerythraea]|uniref:Sodium/hydrogen exchanger n=1 Tax=Colwellia psychrerythraea TaxID=28229 RepID=A0A099KKJ2_COLPS|nr:sodium:proton antiporter [Colwellia psychrerythraea]KGJ90785.1 sodium/hydrogen exchanger [Colwellia psychrerythraea]